MRFISFGPALVGLFFLGAPALAQQPDFTLNEPKRSGDRKAKAKAKARKVDNGPYYAAIGEGQTLPAGVIRVRVPYNYVTSGHGYDKDGQRQDLGLKLKATATAFVLEYGVTGRMSLQLLAPYILSNELGLDGTTFAKSDLYKERVAAFLAGVASKLQAQGICPSPEACARLLDEGYSLPVDTSVTLPTGESLTLRAGVPVKSYAGSIVTGAARPKEGRTGLGDVEIGMLFSVFRRYNFGISVGAGLRLPTGSFADVPAAERGTGRGTVDFGLRTNVDFAPAPGLWIGWQNQAEQMLKGGTKRQTSLLDNGELTDAEAQELERVGIRNVGFFKVGWGLGTLTQSLASLGVQTQFKYAKQSEDRLDNVAQGPRASSQAFLAGASFDGLAYRLPLQVAYDHEVPIGGTNVTLATTVQLLTLKAYYKF